MTDDFNPASFFILGFEGAFPGRDFLQLMEKYPPAGFIFLEHNYQSPEQLSSLVAELKSITGDTALFSVDQEPGRVQRFKKRFPVSRLPSHYVENSLEEEFREWCAETAALLYGIGINLNLAPVLDLCPFSEDRPVLNGRTFGDDPRTVISYAEILIQEHRKKSILTCGKHFPGLGSAAYDPHERLSVSGERLEKFIEYHWKPFTGAINSGVDIIMTTHLKAEHIDPGYPATYSSETLRYLGDRLGFRGLVISDDLGMAGAGNKKSIGEFAAGSIAAGHNLLIISRDVGAQASALEYVKNRYTQDDLFRKIADDNEKAIRRFQSKIGYSNS
jgi:beta-N-acetylhexosaminidase